VLYPDLLQLEPDTIIILNCYATPGSLSRRVVEEGSLGSADIYLLLYVIICYSLLMLQDASLR
jgi:hypothetical protein